MKIKSKSQLPKGTKLKISNFKKMFCENESKKYKIYEYPNFKDKIFWNSSKKFDKNGKFLIISGPARSGNHLLLSLLDGHKDIASHPGEDDFLRSIFTEVNKSEKNLIKKLKSKDNWKFILSLSGQAPFGKKRGFNKWKKLDQSKNAPKIWSGKQKEGEGHIFDYQDVKTTIDYKSYENFLKDNSKKIMSSKTFLDIFLIYLKSINKLSKNTKNKKKFKNLWFGSGLRRELKFLLERSKKTICLVPIRRFETFYFSYSLSRHNTTKVRQKALDDLWEHWRHKVLDYLILKKKYPKNILIIQYEDLVNNTENTLKKISKNLGIKYNNNLTKPTILSLKTKGNSTYGKSDLNFGKIYKSSTKYTFPKGIMTDEYNQIIKLVKLNSL